MESTIHDSILGSSSRENIHKDIVPLPRLRATANAPSDHSFFEPKGIPQSSLDNYGDLEPNLFSHPYLYSLSWGHKVIRFFCKPNDNYPILNIAY